jgi:hypothetical protein
MSKRNQSQSPSVEGARNVRGRPFKPGNPGRPPGSKNKTTLMLEGLIDGEADKLGKKMVELANKGNVRCLEYCLDHLLPKRSGRSVEVQLPKINGAQDIATAMGVVANGISNGSLTLEEASNQVQLLDSYRSALIANDFDVRLQRAEAVINMKDQMWNSGPRGSF